MLGCVSLVILGVASVLGTCEAGLSLVIRRRVTWVLSTALMTQVHYTVHGYLGIPLDQAGRPGRRAQGSFLPRGPGETPRIPSHGYGHFLGGSQHRENPLPCISWGSPYRGDGSVRRGHEDWGTDSLRYLCLVPQSLSMSTGGLTADPSTKYML